MNLKGVIDTDRTERYLWAVCGSTTVAIVGLTALIAMKQRARRGFHRGLIKAVDWSDDMKSDIVQRLRARRHRIKEDDRVLLWDERFFSLVATINKTA